MSEEEGESAWCPVVKVYVTHAAPCFSSPWRTSSQWSSVGSSFPIDNRWLVTNAHVVANAHLVHVRRSDGHLKYVAKVHTICFDCDLALLEVAAEDFWQGLEPVSLCHGLPQLQDEVTAVGFPDSCCSGDAVCVTQGVVSRIGMHDYSWQSRLLVVQIDAAINPGNSGGPCLDANGSVVGVTFQKETSEGKDNIGYIIPMPVVDRFLSSARGERDRGFGYAGFRINYLDNPSLRKFVGMPESRTGVLITSVQPTSPAKELVQPQRDVVLSVDGNMVGEDGTVALPESLVASGTTRAKRRGMGGAMRVSMDWIFRMKAPTDTVTLEVFREGQVVKIELPLWKVTPLVPADPLDGERLGTRPEYLLIAGLVFIPLTEQFLTEEYGEQWEHCPSRLRYLWQHLDANEKDEQVVLLSDVLACEFTRGYEDRRRLQVQKFNGERVRSLAHLASIVDADESPFLCFELAGGSMIALESSGVDAATSYVMELNQIAKSRHIIDRALVSGPVKQVDGSVEMKQSSDLEEGSTDAAGNPQEESGRSSTGDDAFIAARRRKKNRRKNNTSAGRAN
mmetsp:Transcript_74299/g.177029  ORF Transcript_74299/g.177029 Transcript_74299/m.177029 type:complete len:565 (+) Transcript_74299:59-1753(+)